MLNFSTQMLPSYGSRRIVIQHKQRCRTQWKAMSSAGMRVFPVDTP